MGWFESLSGAVSGAVNTVTSTASNVVSGAVSTAGNIASTASNVVSGAVSTAGNIASNVVSTGSNIASSAVKTVTSAPATISNAVSSYIAPKASTPAPTKSTPAPTYNVVSVPAPYKSVSSPAIQSTQSSTSATNYNVVSAPAPTKLVSAPSTQPTQSPNPISNIINSAVQTQTNINKSAVSTLESLNIIKPQTIQPNHIQEQLNKPSPIPAAVVPSNLNRQLGNTGVYVQSIGKVIKQNTDIIPGTYKSNVVTTPSQPTPLNFLANFGGSVYNEVAALAGITGVSLPIAKTDYGFGSTTTTTSYQKNNYDITTLPKSISKGGADYTGKLVSSTPIENKTITETTTIKDISEYEKINKDFSKQLKSTLPTMEKPVEIKNGGILGTLANYGSSFEYGLYEKGIKERPLDVIKYSAEGVMIAAFAPAIGGYIGDAVVGTRLAPVVTTLSEWSPTILKAAVGYGVTKESTSGFTDFSPKATEKAGEISGVQLLPMIAGGESYSRIGGGGRVSSPEVTSEYNLGIVSKGKYIVNSVETKPISTYDLTDINKLNVQTSLKNDNIVTKLSQPSNIVSEIRMSADEINARNAILNDNLLTKSSPSQSFEIKTANDIAIKNIAEAKGYNTDISSPTFKINYNDYNNPIITADEISARNALKNDILLTKSLPSQSFEIKTANDIAIKNIAEAKGYKTGFKPDVNVEGNMVFGKDKNVVYNPDLNTGRSYKDIYKTKQLSEGTKNGFKPDVNTEGNMVFGKDKNVVYNPDLNTGRSYKDIPTYDVSKLQSIKESLPISRSIKTITLELERKPIDIIKNLKTYDEYQKSQTKEGTLPSQSIQGKSELVQISIMEEKGIKTIDLRPVIDLRETVDLNKVTKNPFQSGRDIVGEMKVSEQIRSSGKNIFGYITDKKINTMYINKLKTDSMIFNKADTSIKTTQVTKTIPDILTDTSIKEEKKTVLYVNPFKVMKENLIIKPEMKTETKLDQYIKSETKTETKLSPFAITRTDVLTETVTNTIPKTDIGIIPIITPIVPIIPKPELPSFSIGGGGSGYSRWGPTRFTETFRVGYGANINDKDLTIIKKGKKSK
jgi:hypothetical protein